MFVLREFRWSSVSKYFVNSCGVQFRNRSFETDSHSESQKLSILMSTRHHENFWNWFTQWITKITKWGV